MSVAYKLSDPVFIGVDKSLKKILGVPRKLPSIIEQALCISDIGFRLLHHRNVDKNHGLPNMVIGPKSPQRTNRDTNHRTGFSGPTILSVGSGRHIDRILQNRGGAPVIFWSKEQNTIGILNLFSELDPILRRIPLIQIFIIEG